MPSLKAVITGGCGFIGRCLVRERLNRKADVTVYDNFSGYQPERLGESREGAKVVQGDILDFERLEVVVRNADVVFHLAAYSRGSGSLDGPGLYLMPTSTRAYNVAEACRKSSARAIFASTF